MTVFSPKIVGSVETRKSISRWLKRSLIRPSCGRRRSAMSRLAMILTREVSAASRRFGGVMISCRTPSTRKRTRKTFS